MKRIAIDMDEVLADTLGVLLAWLSTHHGLTLTPAALRGQPLSAFLPAVAAADMEAMLEQGDIFGTFPPLPDSQAVVRALSNHFEIFITTAAMDYPASCAAKYAWLQRHLDFLPRDHYVFCGDKSIVQADFLIDDSARHFRRFVGQGILFDAPHNANVEGFVRLHDWRAVACHFLSPQERHAAQLSF